MKFIAILLLISTSALAQQQVTTPKDAAGSGTLTTITTDKVTIPILGSQWATVQFMAVTAGTSTVTALVSTDNGTNFSAAPYARRLSTVSVNPTTQPITATTLSVSDIWEVPLAANVTNFQLLCAATGTSTSVVIRGGIPYVPGMPVNATLFDVTSAVNTDNPTGTLDLNGWSWVFVGWNAGGATTIAATGLHVYEDGLFSPTHTFGAAAVAGDFALTKTTSGSGGFYMSRRMSFDVGAVAAQATRLRVAVTR